MSLDQEKIQAVALLRRALSEAPRIGCVCEWDEWGTPIGNHSSICWSFVGVFKEIQDFLARIDEPS